MNGGRTFQDFDIRDWGLHAKSLAWFKITSATVQTTRLCFTKFTFTK